MSLVSRSMLVLLLAACGRAPEPITERSEARAPRQPAPPREEPASGPWYTIELPNGAVPSLTMTEEIDAVYLLDPEEHVSITVLRPVPGQHDLAEWAARTESIFEEHPTLRARDAPFAGVPATLQVTDRALRWVFVADGFGGVFMCFTEEPTNEARLHAKCDATLGSVRLVRPIRELALR